MKRYIYIIVFVFATLFCQAFGSQNEPPTILDTTICVRKGDTIKVYEYEEQILQLLESREKEIWGSCCDKVSVELKGVPIIEPSEEGVRQIKNIEGRPAVIIKGRNAAFSLEVSYIRYLQCSDILKCKDDTSRASVAMWRIFGDLLSETETGTTTSSDTAHIFTIHTVNLTYRFDISFPENVKFKIKTEDVCFDEDNMTDLMVPDEYSSCPIKWILPEGITFRNNNFDTQTSVTIKRRSDDYYSYPIVCRAISCNNDTVFDTIQIGKPTPTPTMEDLACIAANDTSFVVNVNKPNSQLSYYWSVEDLGNGSIIDTQQGASVTMAIPQNKSVRLNLRSSGGCKDAEMEPMILHRSLVSEAHHIEMEAEPNCIFAGDTLRLSLSETPEDTLVWQIAGNTTMLPPHDTYNYPTVQEKENVIVSVYTKVCPNNIITDTFNIREDFSVSLGTSPMCISANEYQVIKLTSNGINPEVHWYGNGVEIDSSTYKKEDSIRLKLTNSGDQNLYVKITAKECGRERDTLLVLHPKPEKPSLDPLLGMLTPCIPLGMVDTIELRVQPQAGVKFKWKFSDNEKFQRVAESDSHSISVVTNLGLLDAEKDKTIGVNIYAYTEGCPDTLEKQETLYATGAGLGSEWRLGTEVKNRRLWVGFQKNEEPLLSNPTEEFELLDYEWYINGVEEEETGIALRIFDNDYPINIQCILRNINCIWKNNEGCPSVYNGTIGDDMNLQSVLFATKQGEDAGNGKGTEALQAQVSLLENEYTPCPGIVLKPNPVHSGVQVKVEGICETESFTVECYSPQGRRLFHSTAKGDTFTLPTDNYAAGVYIVKIQLDGTAAPIVKKLIIL